MTNRENTTHSCGKAVHQIDKETSEILNTFQSISQALEYIGQNDVGKTGYIARICKKKSGTAYGYKWQYAD